MKFKADKNILLVWISQIISLTSFGFIYPFIPQLIEGIVKDQNQVLFWTGVIGASYPIGMGISAPIWGKLADRYNNKIMILRGNFLGCLIIFLLSFSSNIYYIFILRFLQGALSGTTTSSNSYASKVSKSENLESALALISSSTFIGVSIGPLLGGFLFSRYGFQTSFLISSAILLLNGFLIALALESDEKGNAAQFSKKKDRFFLTKELALLYSLIFLMQFVSTLMPPFLTIYVDKVIGITNKGLLGILTSTRGATIALSCIVFINFIKNIAFRTKVIFLLLFSSIFSFFMFLSNDLYLNILFIFLSSLFYGPINPIVRSEIVLRIPKESIAFNFGIQTTIVTFAWFLAPLLGSFISIKSSINHIFIWNSLILLLSASFSIFYKTRKES